MSDKKTEIQRRFRMAAIYNGLLEQFGQMAAESEDESELVAYEEIQGFLNQRLEVLTGVAADGKLAESWSSLTDRLEQAVKILERVAFDGSDVAQLKELLYTRPSQEPVPEAPKRGRKRKEEVAQPQAVGPEDVVRLASGQVAPPPALRAQMKPNLPPMQRESMIAQEAINSGMVFNDD